VLHGLGLLVGALLGLVVLALLALQLDVVQERVKRFALSQVNGVIRGTIEVDELDGPFLGAVALEGVRVKGPDGRVVAAVGRVAVDFRLWPLLSQRVAIERVTVRDPFVLVQDEQGQIALAQAFEPAREQPEPPDTGPTAWVIDVAAVDLSGGTVRLSPAGDAPTLTNLAVRGSAQAGAVLRWTDVVLTADLRNAPVPDLRVETRGQLADGTLVLPDLDVTAGPHTLSVKGRVLALGAEDETAGPRLDLAVPLLRVDLEALAAALGPRGGADPAAAPAAGPPLQGTIRGALVARGPLSDLTARAVLRTPAGPLRLQASADLAGATPRAELTLRAPALSPGRVLTTLPADVAADLRLRAQVRGDPLVEGGAADLTLTLADIRGHERAPQRVVITADVEGGAATAHVVASGPGGQHLELTAHAPELPPPTPVEAVFDVHAVDLGAFGDLAGRADLAGRLQQLTGSARVRLTDDGPRDAHAALRLRARDLRAAPTPDAPLAVGRVDVSLDVRWPGGDALPRGTIRGELEAAEAAGAEVDLASVHLDLTPEDGAVRAEGRLSARGIVRGPETRVARVEVPIDVTVTTDLQPRGTVRVTVEDAQHEGAGVASARVDGRVTSSGDRVGFEGPITAERVVLPGGRRLAAAEARVAASFDRSDGSVAATVALEARELRAPPDDLALGRAEADLRVRVGPEGDVAASGTFGARDFARGDDVSVAALTGDLDVRLVDGEPRGTATARAEDVRLPERRLRTAEVRAELGEGGRARIDLHARGEDFRAELAATVDLPIGAEDDGVGARIETLRVSGAGDGFRLAPGATLRFVPGALVAADGVWLRGQGALRGQAVGLDGTVDLESGRLDARLDVRAVALHDWLAVAERLAGVSLRGDRELRGRLVAKLVLAGTIERPAVRGGVSLREGAVGSLRDLAADVGLELGPDGLQVEAHAAWAPAARLVANARIPLATDRSRTGAVSVRVPLDGELSVDVQASGVDLATLRPLLPAAARDNELSGTADVTVLLAGALRDPRGGVHVQASGLRWDTLEDGRVEADVQLGAEETVARVRFEDRGEGTVPLALDLAAPENLVAVATGQRAGESLLDRLRQLPFTLDVALAETRLGALPFVGSALPGFGQTAAAADLRLEGPLAQPRFSGWARAQGLPLGELPSDVSLRLATSDEGAVTVDGELSAIGTHVAGFHVTVPDLAGLAAGRVRDVTTDEGLIVRLTAPGVPIGTVGAFVPGVANALGRLVRDGHVSAAVVVRGTPEGPRVNVVGHVAGDYREAPGELAPLARTVELHVDVTPEETTARALLTQSGDGGVLTVEGRVETGSAAFTSGGALPDVAALPLEAAIRTIDFDVRGLEGSLPDVFGPSRGRLTVELDVAGTLGDPRPRGFLEAQFERLDLAAAGLREDDLTIRVDVSPERIALQPLRLGRDALDLRFEVATPSYDPAEMRLDGRVAMDRFRVDRRQATKVAARLSGRVAIAGTVAAPSVRGEVTVHSAAVNPQLGGRDVADADGPPEDVVFVAPGTREVPAEVLARSRATAQVSGLELDLSIALPHRSVHVENDMMDLFLSGDLRLQTKSGAISMAGMITVNQGGVSLYGRDFALAEDSSVTFDGGTEINPRLDITARYDISDVDLDPIGMTTESDSKIMISVSGTALKPEIELSSDPPMDDTNIVSIMLTDSPVGGGGENPQGTEQQAANLFVGLATGGLTRMLEQDLPIDTLKVEGGEQGLLDARIQVGKRLTRDLLLVYESNLGAEPGENANIVRLQYEFTRRLQLETHFGDAGVGGLDLLLRWRW
jgi:autotransporter translocation and assembly factor TamB